MNVEVRVSWLLNRVSADRKARRSRRSPNCTQRNFVRDIVRVTMDEMSLDRAENGAEGLPADSIELPTIDDPRPEHERLVGIDASRSHRIDPEFF